MNKLALLAFALLLFFSTMSWYLANGSLNDYLKSQVILQSEYYSTEQAQLMSADFSNTTGIATFNEFSLNNINGLTQPVLLTINDISAKLGQAPTNHLTSPSIQKKTTTLVYIEKLRLSKVHAWSEMINNSNENPATHFTNVNNSTCNTRKNNPSKTNIEVLLERISTQLALDYPALYPQISAEIYAKAYPELNEALILKSQKQNTIKDKAETNQAIIASKAAKQQKRLLGKATTRIRISNVIIDDLSLTISTSKHKENKTVTKNLKNISLGSFGDENGLASNQLGGELLKQLLCKLIHIENEKVIEIK